MFLIAVFWIMWVTIFVGHTQKITGYDGASGWQLTLKWVRKKKLFMLCST